MQKDAGGAGDGDAALSASQRTAKSRVEIMSRRPGQIGMKKPEEEQGRGKEHTHKQQRQREMERICAINKPIFKKSLLAAWSSGMILAQGARDPPE